MANDLSPFEAFELAVSRAGGQSALSRMIGCTPGNISQLIKKRSMLPGHFVLKAEAGTGVPRTLLRPDLYPAEQTVALLSVDPVLGVTPAGASVACNRHHISHRQPAL